jgi:flagellar biosynthesis protein FlhB
MRAAHVSSEQSTKIFAVVTIFVLFLFLLVIIVIVLVRIGRHIINTGVVISKSIMPMPRGIRSRDGWKWLREETVRW